MRSYRLLTVAFACVAAIAAHGASAQSCDGPFPWLCPGFFNPPGSSRPQTPPAPMRILPDDLNEPADAAPEPPNEMPETVAPAIGGQYAALYSAVDDGRFPIPAVRLSDINPRYFRKTVHYPAYERPGTIVIDPQNHFLYLIEAGGLAIRYGVGVGRQGFGWSGAATVHDKQEWPDWYPPKEMIQRQPGLMEHLTDLRGGLGMPGGPRNPLGSRAIYLWQGNKDTLFRIHGTNEPWTIGKSVSSGCIRMINQDVLESLRAHTGWHESRGPFAAQTVRMIVGLDVMDEVIAKIGPEANIEIVEHHSGKVRSRVFLTPQDDAYLARGLLACAAALCGPDPPQAGTIFSDSHVPALKWATAASDGGFLLTIKIQSGIELSFQMPAQSSH